MNEFIKLRQDLYKDGDAYIFPLRFLERMIEENKILDLDKSLLREKLKQIESIESKELLEEPDLKEIIGLLGENQYLDRYIVDIIRKNYKSMNKQSLKLRITSEILENKDKDLKLYHLLDISLEYNIKTIDKKILLELLESYSSNLDLLSLLLEYIYKFKIEGLKTLMEGLLNLDYPDNIKLQILESIAYLYGAESLDKHIKNYGNTLDENKDLYITYLSFLRGEIDIPKGGLTILQSMFYGDFEDSGKGNNGGLAVLLRSLGNEISKDPRISKVVTITINDKSDKNFIDFYSDKHIFARLPIYIDWSRKDQFIKRELAIKRAIHRFLIRANISPDIFHIRFLDNASRAVDMLCRELDKKLVFTLTPDPHRNMFDENENIICFTFDELIFRLNKIRIGDELLDRSQGILGIGSKNLQKELQIYFPQLVNEDIGGKIRMISEGIKSNRSIEVETEEEARDGIEELENIDKRFFERPIILNVGRLNSIKGQVDLLKAWGNSRLSSSHNLLIIGGDLENPTRDEREVISFFKEYIGLNPELKDKFCHIGAIENSKIRSLERFIIQKSLKYPHIYLCASKKEEFGIAILEALLEGFLILGPIKGGVRSYIEDRKNGFLIDTTSWESIAKDSEKIIYDSNINKDEFDKIREEGKRTVRELFSIERIGREFLNFYLSLEGVTEDEI